MDCFCVAPPHSPRIKYRPAPPEDESIRFPKKPHPPVPNLNLQYENVDETQKSGRRPRNNSVKSSRSSNPRFRKSSPQSVRQNTIISPVIQHGPIDPVTCLQSYSTLLTPYEKSEIQSYQEIYYLGKYSKKNKAITKLNNNGFDDANHHYKVNIGDHIAYRYEVKSVFGKGAFGQVLKCYDHKTKHDIALKIIINTAQMHEQGKIEVNIVKALNQYEPGKSHFIVKFDDDFTFRNHICVTFEILGQNLYEYSRSIRFRPMGIQQLQSIAREMLIALAFCHKHRIVHCDMKPENVLLTPGSNKNIRVIDFGSSCFVGRQRYEYIQSRYYRAPEVILGIKYGPPMDIWSFACIVLEMYLGQPIFPGNDEHEQLEMFMEILGAPPSYLLLNSSRRTDFFGTDGRPLRRGGGGRHRAINGLSLRTATKITDPNFLDLIKKCFEWDQTKRISAEEALKHPWFSTKEVATSRPAYRLPGLRWR